jgi:hypothetical protein
MSAGGGVMPLQRQNAANGDQLMIEDSDSDEDY